MNDDGVRAALQAGISYDITMSIDGHPELRRGYRTDSDAQQLLDSLTPIVAKLVSEAWREGRAAATKETADKWQWGEWTILTPVIRAQGGDPVQKVIGAAQVVTDWLRSRADAEGSEGLGEVPTLPTAKSQEGKVATDEASGRGAGEAPGAEGER